MTTKDEIMKLLPSEEQIKNEAFEHYPELCNIEEGRLRFAYVMGRKTMRDKCAEAIAKYLDEKDKQIQVLKEALMSINEEIPKPSLPVTKAIKEICEKALNTLK